MAKTGFKIKGLKARLAKLGKFILVFEADGFIFSETRGGNEISPGVYEMPWSCVSDAASSFWDTCYADGWVLLQFDWAGSRDAHDLHDDRETLAKAAPKQLAMLLTALIRQERFSEGTLQEAFDSGLLLAIVQRANKLAEIL